MKVRLIVNKGIIYGYDALSLDENAVEITEQQARLIDEHYGCIDTNFVVLNSLKSLKEKKNKIKEHKQYLSDTDYKAIKYAEGLISEEEYSQEKEIRQHCRNEINILEEEIKELKSKYNL